MLEHDRVLRDAERFPPHCLCFLLVPFTHAVSISMSQNPYQSGHSLCECHDGRDAFESRSSHGEIGLLGFYKSFACHQPGKEDKGKVGKAKSTGKDMP